MKTFVTTILCVFVIVLSSCKKDPKAQPENVLTGDWRKTDVNGLIHSVKFAKDGSFSLSMSYGDGGGTAYSGTYQIKGDSLKVATEEKLIHEPGKAVQRTATADQLYEKATFSVAGDTLTLKYITYPADAPVPTTAKFGRMITID